VSQPDPMAPRKCVSCKKTKPTMQFGHDASEASGISKTCKDCTISTTVQPQGVAGGLTRLQRVPQTKGGNSMADRRIEANVALAVEAGWIKREDADELRRAFADDYEGTVWQLTTGVSESAYRTFAKAIGAMPAMADWKPSWAR
jgi:hypothetical protein